MDAKDSLIFIFPLIHLLLVCAIGSCFNSGTFPIPTYSSVNLSSPSDKRKFVSIALSQYLFG